MRTTHRLITVVAVMIAALAGASAAMAKTVTEQASAPLASGGRVAASVSYTPHGYYSANIKLTITRAGKLLYSAPVKAKPCLSECLVANGFGAGRSALHVADVRSNGEPVVFLDLYTGGAHCCSVTEFYTYDPSTQSYGHTQYDWGDPGYSLRKLAGKYVFETADDRFAYLFTDYAASGMPIQLLRFNGHRLVDVTRQYPKLIAADAALYLRAYKDQAKSKWADTVGVIAAWAADEDRLGHAAMVARYLNAQAKLKHLNAGIPGLVANARFVKQLDRYLKRWGYLH